MIRLEQFSIRHHAGFGRAEHLHEEGLPDKPVTKRVAMHGSDDFPAFGRLGFWVVRRSSDIWNSFFSLQHSQPLVMHPVHLNGVRLLRVRLLETFEGGFDAHSSHPHLLARICAKLRIRLMVSRQ